VFNIFRGGIHLPGDKRTKNAVIEIMPHPKRVYIHFLQHIGNPASPLVKKGDIVKTGTKIAESNGYMSVPVHSSISGRVTAITNHPHPTLGLAHCCVIESTNSEEWEDVVKERQDYENLTKEELISLIREAGLVGMGGAVFPTHVKLSPPPGKTIDTLIINGCESEPMLTGDYRLMLEYPTGIVEGAHIFQKILDARKLIIVIEDNKLDVAEVLKKEGIEIKILKTKYPQGAEKQLIKAVLNREVPRDGLPMDVGCVVQNVATCYAGFQAVRFKKPLIERVVTVAGSGIKESKNLLVRIGTPVIDIINFCSGYTTQPIKIIFGGPMMGTAQYSEDVPVVKGTSGIIVLSHVREEKERPCVRCSHCVDVCPMGLMPCEIYKFIVYKKFESAYNYGLLDCIECGCCGYVCISKIPLVHHFKYGKSEGQRIK